jgi:hypothetical protein
MQNGRPWQPYSGDKVKHSFRNLLRKEKWTVVAIPAIEESYHSPYYYKSTKNVEAYVLMRTWCEQTFSQGTFASTLNSEHGTMTTGRNRFAFKHPMDATLFALKWI